MNSSLFRLLPLLLSLLLATQVSRGQEPAKSTPPPAEPTAPAAVTPAAPATPATPVIEAATATAPAAEPALRSLTPEAPAAPAAAPVPAPATSEAQITVPPAASDTAPASSSTSASATAAAPSEALPPVELEKGSANEPNRLVPATTAKDVVEKPAKPGKDKKTKRTVHSTSSGQPFAPVIVKAGEVTDEAVSVLASTRVDGEVRGDAVGVLGPNTVNGKVGGQAVAVLNDLTINGEVAGDAVCVMGNVKLGPKAKVHGQIVTVFGTIERDPEAVIEGDINVVGAHVPFAAQFNSLGIWFRECLCKGRLLAFAPGLGIFWLFALSTLLLQVLVALLFHRKVDHCCALLESRPGMSLVSAMLTLLITPLLVIVLIITGVGALLLPFVFLGLVFCGLFGRIVMQAAIGRLFTGRLVGSPLSHAAFTTLLGGLIVLLLYTVPVISILLHPLLGFIGMGVVVYALTQYYRGASDKDGGSPTPPPAKPQSFKPSPSAATSTVASATVSPMAPLQGQAAQASQVSTPPVIIAQAGLNELPPLAFTPRAGGDVIELPPQAPILPTQPDLQIEPPVVPTPQPDLQATPAASAATGTTSSGFSTPPPSSGSNAGATATGTETNTQVPLSALPRATFGLRMLAIAIDYLIVAMVANFGASMLPGFLHINPSFNGTLLLLAVYGALLWKHRGATIGNLILRLQVIRQDDRPLDWTTCIVRGLGCLLSGFALGLGFLWILIDRDGESWHDKIAGTAVVRVPKTRPMV
jgi:uncharacterized RDD family membrane protein YckC/cytoskeletal protein CcmA (bactofilin family)